MGLIQIISDENFNLEGQKFNNPRIRYGARGIVIRDDGKIAIFNKTLKNEYKLPGGGVDLNENFKEAFKREVREEVGCDIEIIAELGTIEEHKSLDNFKQISHVFVGKVIKDYGNLMLTQKEIDEGANLIWETPENGLKLIEGCMDNLKASTYENVYHSKFIVLRDSIILRYYLDNKKEVI